ncbi:hypothetical protein OG21DRAFT_700942 [Imleria badia]|nr:hypothetical protein OG21DRAFT_700942 [Imleria badia]
MMEGLVTTSGSCRCTTTYGGSAIVASSETNRGRCSRKILPRPRPRSRNMLATPQFLSFIEIHMVCCLTLHALPASWSFGGIVAFYIARILIAQGVVLIDSPFPSAPPLLTNVLVERVIRD